MSSSSTLARSEAEELSSPTASVPITAAEADERAGIDASTRGPVLFFFASAVFWLLLGSWIALITSMKLHDPHFLDGGTISWLNEARLMQAQLAAFAYGWASSVGIGVGLWLMARLCRTKLLYPGIPAVAGIFWNLGVGIGIAGILGGDSTSVDWLEIPKYAAPILFLFVLMGVWAVIMFRMRDSSDVYVSQWYLLAAFIWFPWLYATAQLLILFFPVQGVVQSIVNWWFANNFINLWLTSLGLASAYYFIPKVIGRPIYSYYLSSMGFWGLALFSSWTGAQRLIGAPVPVWVQTVSITATFLMLIPVSMVAINHHMTMRGRFDLVASSPTLRFVVFGAMMYTVYSVQSAVLATRTFNSFLNFTQFTVSNFNVGLYAFYSMVMFGAMYYIVPRLAECEWRSSFLIKFHFWAVFYGTALGIVMLSIAGLTQGVMMADPKTPFMDSVLATQPYLVGRSISLLFLLVGHTVFAFHFILMLLRMGKPSGEATLLTDDEHEPMEPEAA